MRAAIKILMAGAAALLAGCGGDAGETASAANACGGDGVVVSNAWARAARAGQPTSAAYLTMCNGAAADDALIAVSMDGARAAELHVTSMSAQGVASMAQAEKITLPAGETVLLEPGGAHVMLIGLDRAISPDDAPSLRLEFEHAPPQEIVLEVRAVADGRQR